MGGVDRPAEGPLGLRARPFGVELVGEVRQHEPLRARPRAVLARLDGRQVAALAVALRPRQRGLDQQQVGARRERAQLVVGPQSAEKVNRAPSLGELDRVGRDEVRDGLEAHRNAADRERSAGS